MLTYYLVCTSSNYRRWDNMTFDQILAKIDDFVWGVPLIVLILAAGLLLTIRTGFIQVRHLPRALRYLFKEEVNEEEEIVHGYRALLHSAQPFRQLSEQETLSALQPQ